VRAICVQEIEGVTFWESERTVDIIYNYLETWAQLELKEPALHEWLERFRADRWTAAREYWEEIRTGIIAALIAGPESLQDKYPEHKVAIIDLMEKRD
jgi:glyceraldehyde-3-phosphate dehydrogenase (ferredoxin)